jgi:hypothetical protein
VEAIYEAVSSLNPLALTSSTDHGVVVEILAIFIFPHFLLALLQWQHLKVSQLQTIGEIPGMDEC